jgi:hypothetical protein
VLTQFFDALREIVESLSSSGVERTGQEQNVWHLPVSLCIMVKTVSGPRKYLIAGLDARF